jgi:hypothetical protein
MNIVSIDKTRRLGRKWLIEDPSFFYSTEIDLNEYVVQKHEDMRIDLVMQSIYDDDTSTYQHCDVILYINDIDNPLNIREGMTIYYPDSQFFEEYRYVEQESNKINKTAKERLGYLNKTTRKDDKRKRFLESDYSLPPTVAREARPGVIVTPTQILIGGLK